MSQKGIPFLRRRCARHSLTFMLTCDAYTLPHVSHRMFLYGNVSACIDVRGGDNGRRGRRPIVRCAGGGRASGAVPVVRFYGVACALIAMHIYYRPLHVLARRGELSARRLAPGGRWD